MRGLTLRLHTKFFEPSFVEDEDGNDLQMTDTNRSQ